MIVRIPASPRAQKRSAMALEILVHLFRDELAGDYCLEPDDAALEELARGLAGLEPPDFTISADPGALDVHVGIRNAVSYRMRHPDAYPGWPYPRDFAHPQDVGDMVASRLVPLWYSNLPNWGES